MTPRHSFYREVAGKIIHVTSISGLNGILRDQRISVIGEKHGLSSGGQDVCQRVGCVSVLDFTGEDTASLFDNPFQNWLSVFTFHRPSIALVLSPKIRPHLHRYTGREIDELGLTGRYIFEAEACHNGDISVEHVIEAWLIAARSRISARTGNLSELLAIAIARERRLIWRKPGLWNLMAYSPEDVPAIRNADETSS